MRGLQSHVEWISLAGLLRRADLNRKFQSQAVARANASVRIMRPAIPARPACAPPFAQSRGETCPDGVNRPTITFSFRPRRLSRLPIIAASVNTRVVSWNEAAEINESVDSEALVMPSNIFS